MFRGFLVAAFLITALVVAPATAAAASDAYGSALGTTGTSPSLASVMFLPSWWLFN